jgi:chaperonin cofactor prefoldin
VSNRAHIDDIYLIQNTDRVNLARYTDSKSKIIQDDLDDKNSLLSGRVTVVENLIPPVQSHLDNLTEDMKIWNDIQTTTQNLQTQLISNVEDISNRFDQYQTLESKFASDILALNSRIAFTLDSFQSIQTVITQNYNNLAGQVLPALSKIELLKQDVTFLKASSYVLIAILAVIVIGLFLYVFVGKKDDIKKSI